MSSSTHGQKVTMEELYVSHDSRYASRIVSNSTRILSLVQEYVKNKESSVSSYEDSEELGVKGRGGYYESRTQGMNGMMVAPNDQQGKEEEVKQSRRGKYMTQEDELEDRSKCFPVRQRDRHSNNSKNSKSLMKELAIAVDGLNDQQNEFGNLIEKLMVSYPSAQYDIFDLFFHIETCKHSLLLHTLHFISHENISRSHAIRIMYDIGNFLYTENMRGEDDSRVLLEEVMMLLFNEISQSRDSLILDICSPVIRMNLSRGPLVDPIKSLLSMEWSSSIFSRVANICLELKDLFLMHPPTSSSDVSRMSLLTEKIYSSLSVLHESDVVIVFRVVVEFFKHSSNVTWAIILPWIYWAMKSSLSKELLLGEILKSSQSSAEILFALESYFLEKKMIDDDASATFHQHQQRDSPFVNNINFIFLLVRCSCHFNGQGIQLPTPPKNYEDYNDLFIKSTASRLFLILLLKHCHHVCSRGHKIDKNEMKVILQQIFANGQEEGHQQIDQYDIFRRIEDILTIILHLSSYTEIVASSVEFMHENGDNDNVSYAIEQVPEILSMLIASCLDIKRECSRDIFKKMFTMIPQMQLFKLSSAQIESLFPNSTNVYTPPSTFLMQIVSRIFGYVDEDLYHDLKNLICCLMYERDIEGLSAILLSNEFTHIFLKDMGLSDLMIQYYRKLLHQHELSSPKEFQLRKLMICQLHCVLQSQYLHDSSRATIEELLEIVLKSQNEYRNQFYYEVWKSFTFSHADLASISKEYTQSIQRIIQASSPRQNHSSVTIHDSFAHFFDIIKVGGEDPHHQREKIVFHDDFTNKMVVSFYLQASSQQQTMIQHAEDFFTNILQFIYSPATFQYGNYYESDDYCKLFKKTKLFALDDPTLDCLAWLQEELSSGKTTWEKQSPSRQIGRILTCVQLLNVLLYQARWCYSMSHRETLISIVINIYLLQECAWEKLKQRYIHRFGNKKTPTLHCLSDYERFSQIQIFNLNVNYNNEKGDFFDHPHQLFNRESQLDFFQHCFQMVLSLLGGQQNPASSSQQQSGGKRKKEAADYQVIDFAGCVKYCCYQLSTTVQNTAIESLSSIAIGNYDAILLQLFELFAHYMIELIPSLDTRKVQNYNSLLTLNNMVATEKHHASKLQSVPLKPSTNIEDERGTGVNSRFSSEFQKILFRQKSFSGKSSSKKNNKLFPISYEIIASISSICQVRMNQPASSTTVSASSNYQYIEFLCYLCYQCMKNNNITVAIFYEALHVIETLFYMKVGLPRLGFIYRTKMSSASGDDTPLTIAHIFQSMLKMVPCCKDDVAKHLLQMILNLSLNTEMFSWVVTSIMNTILHIFKLEMEMEENSVNKLTELKSIRIKFPSKVDTVEMCQIMLSTLFNVKNFKERKYEHCEKSKSRFQSTTSNQHKVLSHVRFIKGFLAGLVLVTSRCNRIVDRKRLPDNRKILSYNSDDSDSDDNNGDDDVSSNILLLLIGDSRLQSRLFRVLSVMFCYFTSEIRKLVKVIIDEYNPPASTGYYQRNDGSQLPNAICNHVNCSNFIDVFEYMASCEFFESSIELLKQLEVIGRKYDDTRVKLHGSMSSFVHAIVKLNTTLKIREDKGEDGETLLSKLKTITTSFSLYINVFKKDFPKEKEKNLSTVSQTKKGRKRHQPIIQTRDPAIKMLTLNQEEFSDDDWNEDDIDDNDNYDDLEGFLIMEE